MEKISLGLKLHNPFNIKRGSQWIGLQQNCFPASICDFVDDLYAVRAFLIILRTYVTKHNVKSVHQFVCRWNPDSNHDIYCASILNCWRRVHFDVAARSDVFDESWFKLNIEVPSDKAVLLFGFVAAVARLETDYVLSLYMFKNAYKMI